MFNRTAWVLRYKSLKSQEKAAMLALDALETEHDSQDGGFTPEIWAILDPAMQDYRKTVKALQEFLRESLTVDGVDGDIREACLLAVSSFDDIGAALGDEASQEEIDANLAQWCECSEKYLAFQDRIERILATTSRTRLEEFRPLKLGWLQSPDQGQPCPPEGLEWVATWLEQEEIQGLPQPYIFPTESGGVQLSWDLGENDLADLEIDLQSKIGTWYATVDDLNAEPLKFDLSTPEGTAAWRALIGPMWLIGRKFK